MSRITSLPPFLRCLLSPALVGITTYILYSIQISIISYLHIPYVRPFGTAYVIPVTIATALGGRKTGYLTLLLSLITLTFVLIIPHSTHPFSDPRNWTEVVFAAFLGLLALLGVEAMRSNIQLLAAERNRAVYQGVLNNIHTKLREAAAPEAIRTTATQALGRAMNADRCYFVIFNHDMNSVLIEQDWRNPDLPSLAGELLLTDLRTNLYDLYPNGKTLVVPDVRHEPCFSADLIASHNKRRIRSLISVPIYEEDQIIAALLVAMADTTRDWQPDEVAIVEAVAIQTRAATEAAQARLREKKIATVLQQALMPVDPVRIPSLNLAHFYKPALAEASVGGDFQDVFPISDQVYALVVGDVSGKGLAAAVQASVVRNMLRCLLYRESNVSDAVTFLNNILSSHDLIAGFTTLFVGSYNTRANTLTYVSCGHEPALLHRHDSKIVEELPATGPILGAAEVPYYAQDTVTLAPNDALIIYTDGLTDVGPTPDTLLGYAGVSRLLQKHAGIKEADRLVSRLMLEVSDYSSNIWQDDICLLAAVVQDC